MLLVLEPDFLPTLAPFPQSYPAAVVHWVTPICQPGQGGQHSPVPHHLRPRVELTSHPARSSCQHINLPPASPSPNHSSSLGRPEGSPTILRTQTPSLPSIIHSA